MAMELISQNAGEIPLRDDTEVTVHENHNDNDTAHYPSAFWAACVSTGVALGLFLVRVSLLL